MHAETLGLPKPSDEAGQPCQLVGFHQSDCLFWLKAPCLLLFKRQIVDIIPFDF